METDGGFRECLRQQAKMAALLQGIFVFILVLPGLPTSQAVMECMAAGHTIDCFECNSWSDVRCLDPFNYTNQLEDMPARQPCEGCCVKLVSKVGGSLESVRRTCTDSLDINLFMVGHVCMTEGGGNGHMCFCEEDDCNTASTIHQIPAIFSVLSVIFYRFYML